MITDWVTKSTKPHGTLYLTITLTHNTMDLLLNQMNPSHLTFMLHFNFILSPMSKFFQLFLLPFGFSNKNYIYTSLLPPHPGILYDQFSSSSLILFPKQYSLKDTNYVASDYTDFSMFFLTSKYFPWHFTFKHQLLGCEAKFTVCKIAIFIL